MRVHLAQEQHHASFCMVDEIGPTTTTTTTTTTTMLLAWCDIRVSFRDLFGLGRHIRIKSQRLLCQYIEKTGGKKREFVPSKWQKTKRLLYLAVLQLRLQKLESESDHPRHPIDVLLAIVGEEERVFRLRLRRTPPDLAVTTTTTTCHDTTRGERGGGVKTRSARERVVVNVGSQNDWLGSVLMHVGVVMHEETLAI